MYKLAIATLLAGSAAAFAPAPMARSSTSINFSVDDLPGALPPMGFFDPLGFADGADEATLKKYREAEVTHGRVAMLAVLGMLIVEEPIEYHPLFEAYNKDIGVSV